MDLLIESDTDVTAKVGEIASLCFAENPTTGYLWSLKSELPGGVELTGSEFIAGGSGIGAAGMRCFRFRGARAASRSLRFELARPWLADQPIKNLMVTLTFAS
jgi:predicted secreted protein